MAKTDIRDTKALLAKLMATENISIEHRAVSTACFNVKTRVLTLPVWQDMDGDMYDLLTGHEVGHAKHTPFEGWHDAVTEKVGRNFKAFLNVLEDARIEKKIKRDYPGLRRPFANAYRDLFNRDFFGVAGKDVNTLNLIDRINLYFKVGSHVFVQFTEQERKYVVRAEQLETWEEVVALAKDVYEYVKEETKNEPQPQTQQPQQSQDDSDDGDYDDGDYDDGDQQADGDQEESDGQDTSGNEESDTGEEESSTGEESKTEQEDSADGQEQSGQESEAGEEENESASGKADGDEENEETGESDSSDGDGAGTSGDEETDGNGDEEDDVESITDNAFREKEKQLVNASARPSTYTTMPTCDLKKTILKSEVITNNYMTAFRECVANWGDVTTGAPSFDYFSHRAHPFNFTADQVIAGLNTSFRNNNNKYIQLMVKEFEMRKNASQYARQHESKSGELDMSKLSKYRFSNDLFKKITTVQKGKSHGMVLFLDMSGSMNGTYKNTIDQLLVLVSFCKKVNIPFEVYGFSDAKVEGMLGHKFTGQDQNFEFDSSSSEKFHLKELITSSMNQRQYKEAFSMLLVTGAIISRTFPTEFAKMEAFHIYNKAGAQYMALYGTPLLEALIASRYVIEDFRKKTQAEFVNVVHLTDGDGATTINFNTSFWDGGSVIVTDPITKKKMKLTTSDRKAVQEKFVSFVREVTDSKHISFFLTNKKHVQQTAKYGYTYAGFTKQADAVKFAKDNNFIALKKYGYDNYFLIDAYQKVEDTVLAVNSNMNKNQVASEFIKHQDKKKNVRIIATSFVKEIAA